MEVNQMNELRRALTAMASQLVAGMVNPTAEEVRNAVNDLRKLSQFAEISDTDAEDTAKGIEQRQGVSMGLGAMLEGQDEFLPWLDDAKALGYITPYYWPRYEHFLHSEALPKEVIYGMDQITDRMLRQLGDPRKSEPWSRRGMVVGHVQSGKTANYIGLICKAADAGYRLIVVIAGIHNNLRSQTQERIDEGFIGRDTSRLHNRAQKGRKWIGVGKFDKLKIPVSLTSTIRDFNKRTATTIMSPLGSFAEGIPMVLVVKKNSNTLKNLVEWLREHSATGGEEMVVQPMLLIDDEADNASINVKYTKDDVSRINGQIRDLLGLFHHSSYVGYTATPFANIFIDPDVKDNMLREDLFPKHFIIGLDAPTNYFGASKVFIDGMPEKGTPEFLRYIEDNEDALPIQHEKTHDVNELPPSMTRALRAFLVARTIRSLRRQSGQHASMLVNASRFIDVQGKIRNRLRHCLDVIRDAVRVDASKGHKALRNFEIGELHKVWREEYADAFDDWEAIQGGLLSAVDAAKIVQVNSQANELNYNEASEVGLTVIAVGGFSLSRGLTLEGLTVSYLLRNSMMYDTLMQMGRWFGYRTGYEDLCRIWMPREAADWYAYIAEATEELHANLKRMERAKATPELFGLAVRNHPSSLMVTARNKIGSSRKLKFSGKLSGSYVETTKVTADHTILEKNRDAAKKLLANLAASGIITKGVPGKPGKEVSGGFLAREVPVQAVDAFLRAFWNDPRNVLTNTDLLRKYIAARTEDELAKWDVFIASVHSKKSESVIDFDGWEIGPVRRTVGARELRDGVFAISGNRSRVASRGVEKTGVARGEAEKAEADHRKEKKIAEDKHVNYPDRIYRAVRSRPLLILHLVRPLPPLPEGAGEIQVQVLSEYTPIVAWGISFPESSRPDEVVEYVVNTTMLKSMFGDEDTDEDAHVDDD